MFNKLSDGKISSPKNFEYLVAVRQNQGGLKVSKENSISPISNRLMSAANFSSQCKLNN